MLVPRRPLPIAILVVASLLLMTTAARAGVLDDLQGFYFKATFGWMDAALDIARSIFIALIGLEVIFTLAELFLRQRNIEDYLASLTFKLISIGIAVTLLTLAPTWIPTVLADFTKMGDYIGQGGGTVATLTPSGIIHIAQIECVKLWNTMPGIGVHPVEATMDLLPVLFAMLMIWLGIGALAVQFALTMIEAYLILGGTAFLLGFIGSRWTMSWAERYFGMLAVMAVKILIVSLLAAFAVEIGTQIDAMIMAKGGQALSVPDDLTIGAAALMYGVIAWTAPVFVAKLMGTAPALQFRSVLSDVSGGAQVAGAAAGSVAGGVGSAVGAVGGAAAGAGSRNAIRSAAAVD